MTSFKYPRDMIAPLKARWYEWARQESEPPALPSDDKLALLLEVAYHASYTADERRGTQFRAVVCSPDLRETEIDHPLRIDPPRSFTPHEIMRLAPAADAAKVMLTVDARGDVPLIWGFCNGADMQLTVSVMAPGKLSVGRNMRSLVALEDGRIFEEGERLGVFQSVIEALAEATDALWDGVKWPGGSWSPQVNYPAHLHDVLSTIRKLGHGGTVLVIPDRECQSLSWRQLVKIKYQCEDDSVWPLLRKSVFQFDEDSPGRGAMEFQYAEDKARRLLERLPGLTAVDGALLLTDRYRVLGFGVEVLAQTELETIFLPDGTSRSVEAYGTRHRSAFRFCAAYPRGAAFVCSQDGSIKCVRNRDGKVTLYE
ncbi:MULTISPECIES: putative sensor domain DACNV-containing protein [Polyangium]|uniref:Diadenylate cyclase n=2 Tax=Polyangium TaxID=55 RepID=A0ABT6NLB8_9BACT|nr:MULTISPECIES: diadenylate cyclase [Polyangium]MDI1429111.1 diadenylate cyclase [Polyangium sorediatum]TKD06373.1 hypothetical protein E8A74_19315 [Polyangium fumosum]